MVLMRATVVVFVLFSASLPAVSSAGGQYLSKDNELRKIVRGFGRALSTGSAAKVSSYFAEDARVMPSNVSTREGKQSIRQYYRDLLGEYTFKSTFTINTTFTGQQVAAVLATGYHDICGHKVRRAEIFTLRRGCRLCRWLIQEYMWNNALSQVGGTAPEPLPAPCRSWEEASLLQRPCQANSTLVAVGSHFAQSPREGGEGEGVGYRGGCDNKKDIEAVTAEVMAYDNCINTNNMSGAVSFFSNKAVLAWDHITPPFQLFAEDKMGIAATLQPFLLAGMKLQPNNRVVTVHVSGNTATVLFVGEAVMCGFTQPGQGREIWVMRKKFGQWKVVATVFNKVSPTLLRFSPGCDPEGVVMSVKGLESMNTPVNVKAVVENLFFTNARVYPSTEQASQGSDEITAYYAKLVSHFDTKPQYNFHMIMIEEDLAAIVIEGKQIVCGQVYGNYTQLFQLSRYEAVMPYGKVDAWKVIANAFNHNTLPIMPESCLQGDIDTGEDVVPPGGGAAAGSLLPASAVESYSGDTSAVDAQSEAYADHINNNNVPGIVSTFTPDAQISMYVYTSLKFPIGKDQITGLYTNFLNGCSPIHAHGVTPHIFVSANKKMALTEYTWYEHFSNPSDFAAPGNSLWVLTQSGSEYLGRFFMFNYNMPYDPPKCAAGR